MSISLNSKTYNFSGFNQQSISQYIERSAGVPSGFSPLTVKVEDGGAGANTKVRWKLKIPVIAVADSECACIGALMREYIVDMVVTVPAGSLAAERTDLLTRIQDLVATPEYTGSITSLLQPS